MENTKSLILGKWQTEKVLNKEEGSEIDINKYYSYRSIPVKIDEAYCLSHCKIVWSERVIQSHTLMYIYISVEDIKSNQYVIV